MFETHAAPTTRKVAIIGSGVSGLGAAWHIQCNANANANANTPLTHYQVTLFESKDRLGGHSHTVRIFLNEKQLKKDATNIRQNQVENDRLEFIDVDTGFIVYNEPTYPNMVNWFEMLNVQTEDSDMSLAVTVNALSAKSKDSSVPGKIVVEWASTGLAALFVQLKNLVRPAFYRMLFDMVRFNAQVPKILYQIDRELVNPKDLPTLREFLKQGKYSDSFVQWYLLPMTAAVWSCSFELALDFPVLTLFRFFHNHRFAQIFGRPNWKTVSNRSKQYVDKVEKALLDAGAKIVTNAVITQIDRSRGHVSISYHQEPIKAVADMANGNGHQTSAPSQTVDFDHVIFACHAPQALALLGKGATEHEKGILAAFQFSRNRILLHTDPSRMPTRKSAWSSWNVIYDGNADANVCVTYWNNRLQNLDPRAPDIFETLNAKDNMVNPDKILYELEFAHPQYSSKSVESQIKLAKIQGENKTFFAGAYTRYGFHEDGLASGLAAAVKLTGVPLPWYTGFQLENGKLVTNLVSSPDRSIDHRKYGKDVILKQPKEKWLLKFCRKAIHSFLNQSIVVGRLTLIEQGSSQVYSFGETIESGLAPHVVIRVLQPYDFYARVLTAADIGLSESFMYGDFEMVGNDRALLDLFLLLIANRDLGPLENSKLGVLSLAKTLVNNLIHLLWKRNTLEGSQKNIEAHYDLSNDLFATFLGKSWMYSCAVFDHNDGVAQDDLDSAQYRKLDMILDKLKLDSSCHMLEIGCGWGELAIRAVQRFGCRVTGISLSREQLSLARERALAAGVADKIDFLYCDYRQLHITDKEPKVYDRIVSVEMLEAVGHEFLGTYFFHVQRLLKPRSGICVIQVITTPEERYEAYRKSTDFISKYIFPGCCCPSFHSMVDAMNKCAPKLVMEHVENIGIHYARTLDEWCNRMMKQRDYILTLENGKFHDVFMRKWEYYFRYCEAGFTTRTLGDLQMTITYPGNTDLLGGGIQAGRA